MKSHNNSSHRTITNMQFLIVERHPVHIYCHGIERLVFLFANLCVISLERGERPLRIVLYEESPYDLINVLSPFPVILQQ